MTVCNNKGAMAGRKISPWSTVLIFYLIACNPQKVEEKNKAPNIILILADDMGYGDIGGLNPNGRIVTPALDRLVREGITFTNAHSSASVCTPSRYGILTGRYAFRSEKAKFGVWGFEEPVIESERETIASILTTAGYATAVIGKWHLGLGWLTSDRTGKATLDTKTGHSNVDFESKVRVGPNDYGFGYSFIHPASLDIPPYVFLRNHQVIDPDIVLTTEAYPARLEDTEFSWDKKHTDDQAVYWEKGVWWRQGEMSRSFRIEDCQPEIIKEGLAFLDRQANDEPDKPFFLYMPLTGPHTPWVPSEKNRGKSPIGLYGDFVMDIDDVVDQVQNNLIKNKIAHNTILIFSSDNGAYWPEEEVELHGHDSNWGRRGQKGDVWEGGHRVPLVISWPAKIQLPAVYRHLVSLTDLFATVSELLGLEIPASSGEDSFSFLSVINGDLDTPVRESMVHHSSRDMYSIRDGEWKYIEGLGSGGFTFPDPEEVQESGEIGQLYRIMVDSLENNNLFREFGTMAKDWSNILDREKKLYKQAGE